MAEHGLNEPVLAIILDGAGLGDDGTLWGGEIMAAELSSYRRLGRLAPLPLPGGDVAAQQPWRMGLAALHQAMGPEALQRNNLPTALQQINDVQVRGVASMLAQQLNCPLTSSCGRLFDAVASLLGIRQQISFEGQAAMGLESLAASSTCRRLRFAVGLSRDDQLYELPSSDLIKQLFQASQDGVDPAELAWAFHQWLSEGLLHMVEALNWQGPVVLSGGCLQNSLLRHSLSQGLDDRGFRVYSNQQFPVNDGCVSLGQAIIGGLRHVPGRSHAGH